MILGKGGVPIGVDLSVLGRKRGQCWVGVDATSRIGVVLRVTDILLGVHLEDGARAGYAASLRSSTDICNSELGRQARVWNDSRWW